MKWRWFVVGILFLLTVLVWYLVLVSQTDDLEVYFLDVGQGDAIFIEAPNGNQMLIDGGQNKQVIAELSKVMPFYDRSIDVVMFTHPDADHIGGLPFVLERFEVEALISGAAEADSVDFQTLKQTALDRRVKQLLVGRGTKIKLDEYTYLEIIFPDLGQAGLDGNDSSLIGRLVFGDTEFMLTGDTSQNIERYLVDTGMDLEAEVLKVGHHGSKTSTSGEFLEALDSQVAIFSAGADNQYGHPHQEVVDLLADFGVSVFNTAESGTIKVTSDGRVVEVE